MDVVLGRNWWAVALRGVLAVLFGVIALFFPQIAVTALVTVFGVYALIDGVLAIVAARRAAEEHRDWGIFALEGVAGVLFAVACLLAPFLVAAVLVTIVAFWAVVTGVLEIVAAVRLRREIETEWLLGLAGVLSVIVGVLLFIFPVGGALTFATIIGAYSLIFGITLIALAFRLRGRGGRSAVSPRRI